MYELTNEKRHAFYDRMAIHAYEQASLMASRTGLSDFELSKIADDLSLAEKELNRAGLSIPSKVEFVLARVRHYQRVANEYAGSWVLVEAATGRTIEEYNKDTELSDFIAICKEVARANEVFLKTALNMKVNSTGEVVEA